jgi:hypothetical protein
MHLIEETFLLFLFHLVAHFLMAQLKSLEEDLGILSYNWKLFHFESKFLFDFFEGLHVVLRHESDGFAFLTYSGCSANAMDVIFRIAKIVVDDKVDQ